MYNLLRLRHHGIQSIRFYPSKRISLVSDLKGKSVYAHTYIMINAGLEECDFVETSV